MNITALLGLDLTPGDRAPGSLDLADEVAIDTRGSAVRRPGLRRLVDLPAASAGLYAVDDTLRVCAPNGTSSAGLFPTLALDLVDAASVAGRVQAVRLASGRRALLVEHTGAADGPPSIHITHRLANTDQAGSAVALPPEFAMPTGLIGLYGRLLSIDRVANRLRWSGIDDPDINDGRGYVATWAEGEPFDQMGGSVDLGQGSSEPLALAEYRGRAAVFLRTQVQTWLPGADGIESLDQTITGPGTRYPDTVAAVSGDLLYVDAGSVVHNLATDNVTEGASEGSIGTQIEALSRSLFLPGGPRPGALFSRGLSCYLAWAGTTVLCQSMTPGKAAHGWSRWSLPLPGPIDHMAEVRGVVYIRCGTALFYLEPLAANDETSTGVYQDIAPLVRLAPLPAGEGSGTLPGTASRLGAALSHASLFRPSIDGVDKTEAPLSGRAPAPSWRLGSWPTWRIALQVRATAAPAGWRIDGFFLE